MALRGFLACAVSVALLVAASVAAAGQSSGSGSSKGGSSSKSGSKSGFSSSKSELSASKSGTRSSKSGTTKKSASKAGSKAAAKAVAIGGSGAAIASPPVREDGSTATDVRFRGGYFTETTFAALPCTRVEVSVGGRHCWRCGDAWFEKLVYDGQPLYVEVFAPEGARTEQLPVHAQAIHGESTTYFAADDALYAPADDGVGGFVVVSTSPGFRVDELPEAARHGVPIVAGGATYYRYLGVYYREVHDGTTTYYVASETPF